MKPDKLLDARRAAEIISRLSGPLVELPLFIILMFLAVSLPASSFLLLLSLFLLIGWFLPAGYFAFSLKKGWVKDVDTTDRKDRYRPYAVIVVSLTVLLVAGVFVLPAEFVKLFAYLHVLTVCLYLATFFFKISAHAAYNTFLYLLVNMLTGWFFWWAFPWVLLVCWARWINRRHTLGQLAAGVALTIGVWVLLSVVL